MHVFALSDPHLSFGVPGRSMDRFGEIWRNHPEKIQRNWEAVVSPDDVVLVPGDISWAKKLEEALPDLLWLDKLPGRKVILRGNHDIWWPSASQMDKACPPSVHFIHNNHVILDDVLFFGTRLWDTDEYSAFDVIEWDPAKGSIPGIKAGMDLLAEQQTYDRELQRLRLSIESIPADFKGRRVALTHYPPLSPDLQPSRASTLITNAGAKHVVFGHLHSIKDSLRGKIFGKRGEVHYHLTAVDYIDFNPKLIL